MSDADLMEIIWPIDRRERLHRAYLRLAWAYINHRLSLRALRRRWERLQVWGMGRFEWDNMNPSYAVALLLEFWEDSDGLSGVIIEDLAWGFCAALCAVYPRYEVVTTVGSTASPSVALTSAVRWFSASA